MVHYMTGSLCDMDVWLRAGVLVSECVIIIGGRRPPHDEEHMVDAAHIMAAQKISKLVWQPPLCQFTSQITEDY